MKVLGLDISSSTIGYSVLEADGDKVDLLSYSNIKPPSKKKSKNNFQLRLNFAFDEIRAILEKESPDIVVIEDYSKRFTAGRSSANTIIVLACFNEICSLSAYRVMGESPKKIPVSTIRKLIRDYYKEEVSDKEDVLRFCKKYFKNFLTRSNRVGNIKKECYDEADSIVVALGYILSEQKLS